MEQEPIQRYRVRLDERGAIELPVEIRDRLGLEPGAPLTLEIEPYGMRLITLEQALKEAQDRLRSFVSEDPLVSEELIAERRAEAAREEPSLPCSPI